MQPTKHFKGIAKLFDAYASIYNTVAIPGSAVDATVQVECTQHDSIYYIEQAWKSNKVQFYYIKYAKLYNIKEGYCVIFPETQIHDTNLLKILHTDYEKLITAKL